MPRLALPSGTPAELAEPASGSPRRGVVVAPDVMGLRPLFDDLCARLAAEHQWKVCAVEPFPGRSHMPIEERMATPLDPEAVVRDLVAAADLTRGERVAVLGFCRGGLHAFQAAGSGRFDRAVAFYGMIRIPEHWRTGKGTGEPLEELARPEACPTLAILGGRDEYTPPDDIEALRALPNVDVVVYPEAEHGFVHDPARPTHRAADAADAWRRVAAFLA